MHPGSPAQQNGQVGRASWAVLPGVAAAQWLALRLQLIAAVIVFSVALLAVLDTENVLPSTSNRRFVNVGEQSLPLMPTAKLADVVRVSAIGSTAALDTAMSTLSDREEAPSDRWSPALLLTATIASSYCTVQCPLYLIRDTVATGDHPSVRVSGSSSCGVALQSSLRCRWPTRCPSRRCSTAC